MSICFSIFKHTHASLSFAFLKDYYSILELPVTATITEIKKAYRKLVMQYHPDKTGADAYSTAHFNEIKEAYEVLTNPAAKEQYLQERWLKKAAGTWMPDEPVTPVLILKKALELNKSISLLDVHRMDVAVVAQWILQLIPNQTIERLKTFQDAVVNATIITILLQSCAVLPAAQTIEVANQLRHLAGDDKNEHSKIDRVLLQKKKEEQWERLKILFVIAVVALICIIIRAVGK